MTGIISILQWVIANWQIIGTAFSSVMSIALFFMHGAAKTDIAELQQFISSLQLSQTAPVDTSSAQVQTAIKNPKI